MKYPKVPDARHAMNPTTSAERAVLYEAALREMEHYRDDMIAACATLRRVLESEQKIAAIERGEVIRHDLPSETDAAIPHGADRDPSLMPLPAAPHPARTEEP